MLVIAVWRAVPVRDYDVARSLLAATFEAAAADGPSGAIRETVLAIEP